MSLYRFIFMYKCCSQSYLLMLHTWTLYHIAMKSHCTLKSGCPQNISAYFSQFIAINAALEISPHGTGSTMICICAHALYMHTKCTHMSRPVLCHPSSFLTLICSSASSLLVRQWMLRRPYQTQPTGNHFKSHS